MYVLYVVFAKMANKTAFKTNGWVLVLFAGQHQGDFSQTGG